MGERSGSGLCDLFSIWNEKGFEKPIIIESFETPRITLTWQVESAFPAGNDSNQLVKTEQRVLMILHSEPTLSAKNIAEKTSVSVATVNRTLQSLKIKDWKSVV